MASVSGHTASSSSASGWTYDVFLSFRGEDTRKGFTDHLYSNLKQKGFLVFRDDEKLKRGGEISQELLKMIEKSEYAVVVISENYAFSKWCLIELTKIMKCRREIGLTVLPVFYHVDPSDVRKQKGIFEKAFAKHAESSEVDQELWTAALEEVGHLAGWHVHADRYESIVIDEICGRIDCELSRNVSNLFSDFVGIEYQVQVLKSLLCIGVEDVRFIGICGMGGVGKTTLARVIYETFSSQFDGKCFLENVREKSSNLASLQRELVSEILNERDIEKWNTSQVLRALVNRVRNVKAFIVLDDVNKDAQINELARTPDWFSSGSRILITSRDSRLLEKYEAKVYDVKVLNDNEAMRLFSWEAFRKPNPKESYEKVSKNIVNYAKGLPLALKIFGSSLYGSTRDAWESALDYLKAYPNDEILGKLEISFNGLTNLQKSLFLDIACFFKGDLVNEVFIVLKALGHFPELDIPILKSKYLIKFSKYDNRIEMHDLLQEMGQQIVCQESLKDPGRRSRLWCHEDIISVLKNNTGTDAVEAIVLKLPLPQPRKLSLESFSNMRKLKMLVICPETTYRYEASNNKTSKDLSTVIWDGDLSKFMLSNELRVIKWWGYPLEYLPTNFEPENLVKLKMPMSSIKQLWDATKNFEKLKYINLKDSPNLVEMPDLEGIPNIKKLDIRGTAVAQLSSSIEIMEKFHDLRIGGSFSRLLTFSLHDLPSSLRFLRKLNLSYCSLLEVELLNDASCSSSLEKLDLSGNNFIQMPSISRLWKLETLDLSDCSKLKSLPPKLQASLKRIRVNCCPSLTPFSDPKDLLTFREMLVSGDIAVKALFFGSNGKRDRAWHVGQLCINDSDSFIEATISWGLALTSDIPEWFNQKGTSLPDISGTTFRFDFNVNVHLLLHTWWLGLGMDSDMVSDLDLLATNFYDETPLFEGERMIYSCWGYALFIVYEVVEVNSCERNCSSTTTFPEFVCELEVNNEDHQKVPKKCRGTSPKVPLAFRVPEIPSVGRNGIWVFLDYECFAYIAKEMCWNYIGSCSITISSPSPNVEVKECGGRLVLKHDRSEFCEIVRSLSTHGSECYDVVQSISPNLVPVFSPFHRIIVLARGNQGESVLGKRDSIIVRRKLRYKWITRVQRRNYWTRESPEWKSEQQRRERERLRRKWKRQQRKRQARKAERGVEICEKKEEEGVKTYEESEEEEGVESCEEESEEEEGVESCEEENEEEEGVEICDEREKEFVEICEKGKEEGRVEICEDEKEEGIEICEAREEEGGVEIFEEKEEKEGAKICEEREVENKEEGVEICEEGEEEGVEICEKGKRKKELNSVKKGERKKGRGVGGIVIDDTQPIQAQPISAFSRNNWTNNTQVALEVLSTSSSSNVFGPVAMMVNFTDTKHLDDLPLFLDNETELVDAPLFLEETMQLVDVEVPDYFMNIDLTIPIANSALVNFQDIPTSTEPVNDKGKAVVSISGSAMEYGGTQENAAHTDSILETTEPLFRIAETEHALFPHEEAQDSAASTTKFSKRVHDLDLNLPPCNPSLMNLESALTDLEYISQLQEEKDALLP